MRSRGAVIILLLTLLPGCGALSQLANKPSVPSATVTVTASPTDAATTPAPTPSSVSRAPETLPTAYKAVKGGVVRFEVAGCDFGATGSGFAISSRLVVTAAHVVEGAQVIRMMEGTFATAGTVIGIDPGADVALVRTAARLPGATLAFANKPPEVGDEIGAIGFPKGDPLSFNIGTVSGLNRKANIDGTLRHGLIEMDVTTTHGSSGGPVIRADSEVVGIVDAGDDQDPAARRLAVSSGTADPLVQSWRANPEPQRAESCDSVLGPDGLPVSAEQLPKSEYQQAISTLNVYFQSINNGDFSTAVAQLIRGGDVNRFAEDVASSHDADFELRSVEDSQFGPVLWLTFTSQQDEGDGPAARPEETCTRWSLDYGFRQHNGLWLIDGTQGHNGQPKSEPC